jgi:MoaA/NifB/PqqE/SkfB family radical SAM enzyme
MAQRLGLHLTDRCQLDCQHCLRDPAQRPTDLSLALIENVLDQARQVYRIEHVSLTGGEPLLHPEFPAVIDAVGRRGMNWGAVTNGAKMPWLLNLLDESPARRAAFQSITHSLDGATEATHDRIRGPGSYRQVMTAAALCHARRLTFSLQMAVHAGNDREIESLGLLACELGANQVSFALTQPTGTVHDADLFLPPADLRRIQARLVRLASALKIPVNLPEGHFVDQPFYVCRPQRSETLHVDVHGRLTMCCLHSDIPGEGTRNDVGGDLAVVPLAEAHRQLLDIIRQAQAHRLDSLASTPISEWDHFPCNQCLRDFGHPHWTDSGVAGPSAMRPRWTSSRTSVKRLRVLP